MIHRGGQIIIMAFIFPLLSWPYLEHAQLDPFPIPSPSKYVVASNNIVITPTLPRHHFHTSNWLALGTDSYSWNLPNGNVHFDTPLSLLVGNGVSKKELVLFNPVFLGSGGSGAVFSFNSDGSIKDEFNNDKIAIKVSWKASRSTVQNECNILQTLESFNVPHIEQCIAQMQYDQDRTMISLIPVVTGRTSSIVNLDLDAQQSAIQQVVETMIGMLAANTITVDVQPLISDTGDVLFIDFTEAMRLSSPPTAADLTGVVGFCNEMMALIPENGREHALAYLKVVIADFEKKNTFLDDDILDVVRSIWLGE